MSIALSLDHASQPARPPAPRPHSLVGLSKPELRAALASLGLDEREAKMRASQLWNWIYHHGVTDFERMTNIQKGVRQKLADAFLLDRPEIVSEQISVDGTRKWLFRYRDPKNPLLPPAEIETVYIPESGRGTLCVSSQVGCTLTCSFCHTGTQRLVRNLTADEIVGQILVVEHVGVEITVELVVELRLGLGELVDLELVLELLVSHAAPAVVCFAQPRAGS